MTEAILKEKLNIIVSAETSSNEKVDKLLELFKNTELDIDICLRKGCNSFAQTNYRLCSKHLREAHAEGFDDSNK